LNSGKAVSGQNRGFVRGPTAHIAGPPSNAAMPLMTGRADPYHHGKRRCVMSAVAVPRPMPSPTRAAKNARRKPTTEHGKNRLSESPTRKRTDSHRRSVRQTDRQADQPAPERNHRSSAIVNAPQHPANRRSPARSISRFGIGAGDVGLEGGERGLAGVPLRFERGVSRAGRPLVAAR
jgi:hypothetical protein